MEDQGSTTRSVTTAPRSVGKGPSATLGMTPVIRQLLSFSKDRCRAGQAPRLRCLGISTLIQRSPFLPLCHWWEKPVRFKGEGLGGCKSAL